MPADALAHDIDVVIDDVKRAEINTAFDSEGIPHIIIVAPNKEEKLDNVTLCIRSTLKDFNVERVHQIMNLMQWTWVKGNSQSVPTVDEIKRSAEELLYACADHMRAECVDEFETSTGGLRASMWIDEAGGMNAKIEFIAVESFGTDENDD